MTTISCKPLSRVIVLCIALFGACSSAFALELTDIQGERDNLNNYVGGGKWTLVMTWSLDCIPCEKQKPMIADIHRAGDHYNARVIGLALDGQDKLPEIIKRMEKNKTQYTNLVAFPDVIAAQFKKLANQNVSLTPSYILYAPEGQLAGVHVGPIAKEKLEHVFGR